MTKVIRQLLESPLVLINIVAEADLGVDIVSKKVNMSLALRASIQTWEFEQSLLDTTIVVHVNGVLKHVVDEVRRGLDKVVKG